MKVLILRGLPGSGKSTWLATHTDPARTFVCSADHYHVDADGVYRFKAEKARAAHNECLRRFVCAIQRGDMPLVAVDNTNLSTWEIAAYVRVAEAFGAEVEIVHCLCSLATAQARNLHAVPPETILRMLARVDALPSWWKLTTICTDPTSE